MKKHEQSSDDFVSSGSSNISKSENYDAKLAGAFEQAHSTNTLHLISAFCQITLGITVILLSVTGLIKPLWISTALSMLASLVTMVGLYFLYTVVYWNRDTNRLLRDAMRRIMDAKN